MPTARRIESKSEKALKRKKKHFHVYILYIYVCIRIYGPPPQMNGIIQSESEAKAMPLPAMNNSRER